MVDSYFDGEFNLIKTENRYWQITPLPSEEDFDAHYWLNYYQNPYGTYQSNYIQSSKRGPEAHKSRILLENHINSGDIKLVTIFWKDLAQLRMGRAVTLISSKMV